MDFIKPEIVRTADGSHSLYVAALDETYHSHHGALRESQHVYIHSGLDFLREQGHEVSRVFEMGLGTGLNAFLTVKYAEEHKSAITYHSIEKYPVEPEALHRLNYLQMQALEAYSEEIEAIIDAPWDEEVSVNALFSIRKIYADFLTYDPLREDYDAFYFDAFGFRAQDELWSEAVFQKAFSMLRPGGVLVTYAAKGLVRRTMQKVGFEVQRIPGAPGKREMLRAIKP